MELRICDFRNSKFQGQAINKQPGGFGFALDQKYTFIATQWYNSNPIGPYFAIFEDSSKIFGSDTINTNNLTVYTKKQLKVYKKNRSYVVDLPNAHLLVKVEENQKKPMTPKQNRHFKMQQKIRVIEQKRYTPENYSDVLSGLLENQAIPNKFISYNNFIKQTFKQKHKNLLNIRESTKEFCLSFHQNGIFLKMDRKNDVVSSVGFEGSDKKPEIIRKYSYFRDRTHCRIEQSINSGITSQLSYQKIFQTPKDANNSLASALSSQPHKQNPCTCQHHKPQKTTEQQNPNKQTQKQCIKNLRQYYKRSLTFINKYLNLNEFYLLKFEIDQVIRQLNIYERGKYGQVKIENNGYLLDAEENPIIPTNSGAKAKEYGLQDLKNQLDKVKAGKGIGRRHDSNRRSGKIELTPVKEHKENRYTSPEKQQNYMNTSSTLKTSKINREQNSRKNNPETEYTRKQRPQRSKSHKALKYLDSDSQHSQRRQRQQVQYQPSRNEQYKDTRSLYTGQKRKSPISYKFKYTEEEQKDSSYMYGTGNNYANGNGNGNNRNEYRNKTPTRRYY